MPAGRIGLTTTSTTIGTTVGTTIGTIIGAIATESVDVATATSPQG